MTLIGAGHVRLAIRIYLTVAAALAGTFLVLAIGVGRELERDDRDGTVERLGETARMAAALIRDRTLDDALADSLGAATGLRVTLMDRTGRVVGDSEVDSDRIPHVENHADRPEVAAALRGETGAAERASATIARALLYVAVPRAGGVVRVAAVRQGPSAEVARARRMTLLAFLGALIVFYPVCLFAARGIAGPLGRVTHTVSNLTEGRLDSRTGIRGRGSVGAVGQAVDRLAETLEQRTGEVREETSDLRTLFDNLDEGLASIDAAGVVRLANRAFARWAGQDIEPGARVSTLFRSPEVLDAIDRSLGGHAVTEEVAVGDRTLFVSARPHRGGALLLLRDLTALRRLEGVRRDFVANVSHELKTPLTSVVGFAEAIAEGGLPGDAAEDFGRRILANASRMRRLVDDLLDLALVESGSWSPSLEPVPVGAIAREVWRELPDENREPGVTLDVEDPEGSIAHADGDSVRQIFKNLLDNAARYAPRDTPIRVRVLPDGAFVRTEVIDRGQGIPSEHRERVFERFYRVDPGRSRQQGGTGLGLAIVKHLVVGHGGEVGIDSAVSRGTTVWFTLPVPSEWLDG